MSIVDHETLQHSYQTTMDDMRQELNASERFWSYIIHAPIVQPVSSFCSSTILRPRSLLVGGYAVLFVLLGTYLLAKLHGYEPSGTEPLIGFVVGWIAALCYDGIMAVLHHGKD